MPPNRHNTSIASLRLPNPSKRENVCQGFRVRQPANGLRQEREKVASTSLAAYTSNGNFGNGSFSLGSQMRILVFQETGIALPDTVLKPILTIDRDAQVKRQWQSVIHDLCANSCTAPEIIADIFTDGLAALRRMNEIWEFRVRSNYSPHPLYLAISRTSQTALMRFEIERHGGHFLYLIDAPNHFTPELEQMRLKLNTLRRSLPYWQIVREGQGGTSRATIHLLDHGTPTRLGGSDSHIAVFAAMLARNALPRSIGEWRKILAEDPLFKPAGGGFDVPSRNTLKAYLHRDFPKYLQRAFNERRSGHAARRVIERVRLDGKTMGYKIRGQCLPISWY